MRRLRIDLAAATGAIIVRRRMADPLPFMVRTSSIHGSGAFATCPIRKGALVAEYLGERITNAEADRRASGDGHTMLFAVDDDLVIDGTAGGNEARFINHSCAPNCEAEIDERRVFIRALRSIEPGEELCFDYCLTIDGPWRQVWERRYRCVCGAPRCRGTMLRLRAQNRRGRMWERRMVQRAARRA